MKKILNSLLLTSAVLWSLPSCNPDCESASRANISMTPSTVLPQSEFLLKSSPPEFLVDRDILIDDPDGSGEKLPIESEFNAQLNGVIATLPQQANSNSPIYVEDPDCSGNFIYVNDLQVKPEEFFFSSDLFLAPPIPLVIVPVALPPAPVNITNAWISPYDREYCLWFVPKIDTVNGEVIELPELRAYVEGETGPTVSGDILQGSREFVVPCDPDNPRTESDPLVNINPVSGIIDKKNNFISITIDRTSKGLKAEHFSGMFIDPDMGRVPIDADWRSRGPCATDPNTPADLYMLLTSSETGQQLLMVKAL